MVHVRSVTLTLCLCCTQGKPYLFKRECEDGEVDCLKHGGYDGFCVELAQKISEALNFDFVIHEVRDGKYGAYAENGSWNGMVGELIRKVSHVVGCSIPTSLSSAV